MPNIRCSRFYPHPHERTTFYCDAFNWLVCACVCLWVILFLLLFVKYSRIRFAFNEIEIIATNVNGKKRNDLFLVVKLMKIVKNYCNENDFLLKFNIDLKPNKKWRRFHGFRWSIDTQQWDKQRWTIFVPENYSVFFFFFRYVISLCFRCAAILNAHANRKDVHTNSHSVQSVDQVTHFLP